MPTQYQARLVSLLRLLLIALAIAGVVFVVDLRPNATEAVSSRLAMLFAVVLVASAALAVAVPWSRRPWQLVLHLVFDLVWIAMAAYLTGGVASPVVLLLFAVLLIGNLILPGVLPFVMPALAALAMATNALLYVSQLHPFGDQPGEGVAILAAPNRVVGHLAVQVAAFFLVDLLGQLLARRLRDQRFFTDELLDQLGEGVLAVDAHGHIAYANDEAVRLLGLPAGRQQGRLAAEVLVGELSPVHDLLTDWRSPLQERLTGPGGRQLVVRVTDLLSGQGQLIGRTLLVADETRMRLLEENARRAEHLASLGEMAAGIAHEVRNPLTSLRGCAQELAEIMARSSNPDGSALASIMVSEADRLGRIVSDFLALSRLSDPRRNRVELGPVLNELRALSQARRDLPPGLKLTIDLQAGCPVVDADPDQLRQVLSNLINNAVEALAQTTLPSLMVIVQQAADDNPLGGQAVEIIVADNGPGIPLDQQERIFTPFFSTKATGTGLGLSLVSRIIRAHEGVLQLTSSPGKGSTFTIYLPVHSQTKEFRRAVVGG